MASLLAQNKSLIILALAGFVQLAIAQVATASKTSLFPQFCYRYYGSISAEIQFLGQDKDAKNYNNTVDCPSKWSFWPIDGALLEICPPSSGTNPNEDEPDIQYLHNSDGAAVAVSLTFNGTTGDGTALHPLSGLNLSDIIVTNTANASKYPSYKDYPPAILTGGLKESGYPQYTINGTETAFKGYEPDHKGSLTASCTPISEEELREEFMSDMYCGTQKDMEEGGCWSEQTFYWNNTDSVNFTISFTSSGGSVDIWTEAPYQYKRGGGRKDAGFRTAVHLNFFGSHTPDEHWAWNQSEANYEEEEAKHDANLLFTLESDEETRLPLFNNRSSEEWLLWYSTVNGSYQINPEKSGSGQVERFSLLLGVCFAGVIFMVI